MSELEWWQKRKRPEKNQSRQSPIRARPVSGEIRITHSIKVKPSIWREFKKFCIDKDTSLSEEIEKMIREMTGCIFTGPAVPIEEL